MMEYRSSGASGLRLPVLSLGLWHNAGDNDDLEETKRVVFSAFDRGITHFDLANNYGPPYGSAERNMGKILSSLGHRNELVISTKAGYDMWPGPYGDGGSRKYLISSLDESLSRLALEYVDIFYHHRPDFDTPLSESMGALAAAVHSGRALYAAVSNYPLSLARAGERMLRAEGLHLILDQVSYSLIRRKADDFSLFKGLERQGTGIIVFSPLAQGLLTSKYLSGKVPADSRATKNKFLREKDITPELVEKLNRLNTLASGFDMSLSQLALAFTLSRPNVTSVIIGARTVKQFEENYETVEKLRTFTPSEVRALTSVFS
jgi:Predicted oxidoreductases (related to aryl-alcohol dehydrogenases)